MVTNPNFETLREKNKKIQNFKNSNYNLILLTTCGTIKKKKIIFLLKEEVHVYC
jgi:hypothetical protein